jgi:hypothetical protein
MLRVPHCLDSRLTDGGKVVSPTQRPRSSPQKHYMSASGTRSWLEELGKLKKLIQLIGSRTCDFRLIALCLNHYAIARPRNIPGGIACPALKADNLTAICEPIV